MITFVRLWLAVVKQQIDMLTKYDCVAHRNAKIISESTGRPIATCEFA